MYTRSQQRSSSPIKDHVDTFTINESFKHQLDTDTFMDTGDSTRSLLAPLYSESFTSDQFKELPTATSKNDQPGTRNDDTLDDESLLSQSISSIYSSNRLPNTSPKSTPKSNPPRDTVSPASSLSSLEEKKCSEKDDIKGKRMKEDEKDMTNITWERWLLKKTIEDIENFNLKRAKRKERSKEKKKLEEEKMKRLEKCSRQRDEWVMKKDLEREEKLKEKEEQTRNEKLKKEEEKRKIEEKALEKYREWYEEKLKKEKEERKKKAEEKRKADEQLNQKKTTSEESYNVWLEKSKNKRLDRSTYGYSNGDLMSYYDMGCSPAPSYKNPIPWVDIVPTDGKKSSKRAPIFSPPLLWKEVEERDSRSKKNPKEKKVVVKHSCVDRNR